MKTTSAIIFLSLILTGCNFSKTASKDLISGLSSTGNKISCDEVYLTVNDVRTSRNSFIYGETFFMNFSNVTGLAKQAGNVFPGMKLMVINSAGDTVMQTADLMSKYPEGMNFSPLLLTADLTIASPIKSKSEYTAVVDIWDTKGDGTYKSKFDFKVLDNNKINVESSKASYDEVYLFSQGNDRVITDNKIKFSDNIYIIIEGLKGFRETGGLVYPGMSIKATDSSNNVVLESDDLLSDYNATGIAASDMAERLSAHFTIPGPQFNNPLHCVLLVWDKKSDASIKLNTDMVLE